MKSFKKLFVLGFLCMNLVACSTKTTTSISSNSSSSTQKPIATSITQEMLDTLAKGYKARAIFSYSIGDVVMSEQYIEFASTNTAYTYRAYEETIENPSLDVVTNEYRYEPNLIGGLPYVHQVELGFDNTIKKYPIVDQNYQLLSWENAGFGNCFSLLSPFSFTKVEENCFSLNMTPQFDHKIASAIANQFSGLIGLTLQSLTFYIDGYNITDFCLTYAPISSLYGEVTYQSAGKFLDYGKDVIEKIKVIEGTLDEDFEKAMEALKSYNFKLDYSMPGQTLKIICEGKTKVLYEIYDSKGKKNSCYGYYQEGNLVQGITRIDNQIYKDSTPFEGSVMNALPTFAISSVFFDKSSDSTENKLIFTYRKDISKDIPHPSDYGMLNKQNVGDLTITIEDQCITITNQLTLGKETFKYYDLNQVTNLITNIQDSCDELTWSMLAYNQPDELNTLLQAIPQTALDQIPTIGNNTSYVILDANQPAVFTIPIDDYASGNQMIADYTEKLIENGFTLDTTNTLTGELYLKTIQIDHKTCQIGARIYLAADFFVAPKVLVYPTYIE